VNSVNFVEILYYEIFDFGMNEKWNVIKKNVLVKTLLILPFY